MNISENLSTTQVKVRNFVHIHTYPSAVYTGYGSEVMKSSCYILYGTAQLQLHCTTCELAWFPQCHRWMLLRGIHVPRLLTLHEHGTMQLFHALW